MKFINPKQAFTLSEVLITLGIIGVVAALTMPTLMANYKKQVTVTQLKRAKSVFEQGMRKRMADIECSDLNCGGITEFMDPDNFGSEIRKTYEVISSCAGDNNCMPIDKNGNTITYKTLGGGGSNSIERYSIFTTKDGAIFGLQDTFCAPMPVKNVSNFNYNCAFVIIDVNGTKAPNQWGRDAFYFILGENGILFPVYGDQWSLADNGTTNETWRRKDYCNGRSSTSSGLGCAARIMENNWNMDY